jgi:hypothetical protein
MSATVRQRVAASVAAAAVLLASAEDESFIRVRRPQCSSMLPHGLDTQK